jgi:hypothetical protein
MKILHDYYFGPLGSVAILSVQKHGEHDSDMNIDNYHRISSLEFYFGRRSSFLAILANIAEIIDRGLHRLS